MISDEDEMKTLQNIEKEFFAPDGIMVINYSGQVIAFDEAAQRLTGCAPDSLILKSYKQLFGETGFAQEVILNALSGGEVYTNIPLDFTCAKGKHLNFLTSISPINQPGQGIIAIVLVFRNTAEMVSLFKAYQEKSHEILDEKNKLNAIFNSRWEGTFTIDKDWSITSFNRAAERITGYPAKTAVGMKCWDIFRSNLCRNGCHMETTISKQNPATSDELIIKTQDDRNIPVRVTSAPLYDGEHNFIGAVETFSDISEILNLRQLLDERFQYENVIGQSKAMQRIYQMIENVSQSDSTVLLTGESGTGKEVIARAIHKNSQRNKAPFMAVNCSAFAETLLESELFGHEKGAFTGAVRGKPGRFELAEKGTLFLDEIGDLSLPVQVKLLRVIENRQYERVGGTQTLTLKARIIAATHKNLEKEIAAGRFREDLFYRIHVINIPLPPLRERLDDLPHLISYFINKYQKQFKKNIKSVSPAAFKLFSNYDWPGNIRELENVLEHAFVVCHQEVIETEHLPERLWNALDQPTRPSKQAVSGFLNRTEKQIIIDELKLHNGHRGKTAMALGMDKSTLWRKMKKFDLL